MAQNNITHDELTAEELDDGYFYCPICGEKDLESFDENVFVQRVEDIECRGLSTRQRLCISNDYKYGVLLCEKCKKKMRIRSWIVRGLFLLAFIMLYTVPIVGIILFLVILVIRSTLLETDFTFRQAWKCGAVRKLAEN